MKYRFACADQETASSNDDSLECVSVSDADSGTSTPDCFSPRVSQQCATLPIPNPTQLSTVSPTVLVACPPSLVAPATPEDLQAKNSFTISLRCAEGELLGLDLLEEGQCLMVDSVRPHSAVEAWNRQCGTNIQHCYDQILRGDQIFAVNSAKDPKTMRKEVYTARLLKLSVWRGPRHFNECCQPVLMCRPFMFLVPCVISAYAIGSNDIRTEEVLAPPDTAVLDPQLLIKKPKPCRFVWWADLKNFSSTNTKMAKKESDFTFLIHADAVSTERGRSSFQASDGKGTIHVKCMSKNVGERTLVVTVGDESHTATHDFSYEEGSICKIPKVFNFKNGSGKTDKVTVIFEFS